MHRLKGGPAMKTVRLNGPTSSKMLVKQIDPRTTVEGTGANRESIYRVSDIMPATTGEDLLK